jgi:hypothetical protein
MEILPDGRYRLDSGQILEAEQIVNLHKTAPMSDKALARQERREKKKVELQEGQCSGPIQLLD